MISNKSVSSIGDIQRRIEALEEEDDDDYVFERQQRQSEIGPVHSAPTQHCTNGMNSHPPPPSDRSSASRAGRHINQNERPLTSLTPPQRNPSSGSQQQNQRSSQQVSFVLPSPSTTRNSNSSNGQTRQAFSGNHDYLESSGSMDFHNTNRSPQVSFALGPSNSMVQGGIVPGDDMIGSHVTSLGRHTYPGDIATDNSHNQHNTASTLPNPGTRTSTTVRPGAYSATGRPVGFFTSLRYGNRNNNRSPTTQDSQAHLPPEMRVPRRSRQHRSVMERISTLMFAGDATVQTQHEPEAEQHQLEEEEAKKMCKKETWIVVVCLIIASIVAVVVAVTVSSSQEMKSNSSNGNSNGYQSSSSGDDGGDDETLPGENVRVAALRTIVKHLTTDQSLLKDVSTPQYKALEWAALDDLATFEWDDTNRLQTRYALAIIFFATNGYTWHNKYNFLSSLHECDWSFPTSTATIINNDDDDDIRATNIRPGVSCNSMTMDVTSINLENNNLNGFIPEEIKALSSLRYLNVASNLNQQSNAANLDLDDIIDIVSPIEDLTYLDISNNMWDGIIPTSIDILSNIEVLHLEMNAIKFTIPETFSRLSNLKELHLDGNENMIGPIEIALDTMSQLEVLNLTGCGFTISPELNFPTTIKTLSLGGNNFDRPSALSTEIGRLSNLKVLSLDSVENLQGYIPSELGMMTNLEVLQLGNNVGLGGPFPWSLLSTSSIREVNLRSTSVHGQLPSDISKYSALEVLVLERAAFRGTIPDSIGNLTSLVTLNIFGNWVEGSIPSTVGMMASLEMFNVGWNRLSGRVPIEMANTESLVSLALQGNQLLTEGSIEFLCSREGGEGAISQNQNIICSCCQIID